MKKSLSDLTMKEFAAVGQRAASDAVRSDLQKGVAVYGAVRRGDELVLARVTPGYKLESVQSIFEVLQPTQLDDFEQARKVADLLAKGTHVSPTVSTELKTKSSRPKNEREAN